MTTINKKTLHVVGAFAAVMVMSTAQAHAAAAGGATNFGTIAENIVNSIASLPSLLSALAYMFGILLGVLGILKIKDHVENPGQTPLKDGAIRLAAGGGLFALPIVYDAMLTTVGTTGSGDVAATLTPVDFR